MITPEASKVEAVLVCFGGNCKRADSADFAAKLQAGLQEAGSNIPVRSNYWCLAACGRKNIILWPNGPIYKCVESQPIDNLVELITGSKPIKGLITSSRAELNYILKMLGR